MKAVAERWMNEIWRGNLDAFDETYVSRFVDRSPDGRASDHESHKQIIAEIFAAFPDLQAEIDDLVVDEATGKVAVRWTATGTH